MYTYSKFGTIVVVSPLQVLLMLSLHGNDPSLVGFLK